MIGCHILGKTIGLKTQDEFATKKSKYSEYPVWSLFGTLRNQLTVDSNTTTLKSRFEDPAVERRGTEEK